METPPRQTNPNGRNFLLVSITVQDPPLTLQTVLARRNDPRYANARSAQDFLLTKYGITHFEPETHLPSVREKPNTPDNRVYCDALRKMMKTAAPLGEIRTEEDVERFRQAVLGEVVVTAEEAKSARKSALLVALFSITGAALTSLFAPARPPTLLAPYIALFVYTLYPVYGLWKISFDILKQRYHTEYGPLSILRQPTMKEALEVSDMFRVRSLGLRLFIVACAVLVLIWLK